MSNKCSGVIGYALAEETQPGVWSEGYVEKKYYGDIVRDNRRIIDNAEINGTMSLSNNISIVANSFVLSNMAYMRYITVLNSKWKIESAELKPPRIILTLGGLFNE